MRLLKIESLPSAKEWIDRDFIMLHACFQLLTDCMEKEELDAHCNYEAHKDIIDEIRLLDKWWKKRKLDVFNDRDEDNEMLTRLIEVRQFLWT